MGHGGVHSSLSSKKSSEGARAPGRTVYLGLDEPLEYRPPWAVPASERRRWLAGGDLRIAYIYENEDSATFRYRVFNMVEALRASPEAGASASWFTRMDFQTDRSFVDDCDVLVICRTRYDAAVGALIERAKSRDVAVLFDLDDLLVESKYVHYIMDVLGVDTSDERNWDYWYAYTGRLGATLDLCDASIVTTEPLADHMRKRTSGKPCAVVPNFMNRLQTEVSSSLRERKKTNSYRRDGTVTLGYLSGSPTHVRDFDVALPAMIELLERDPTVRLRLVGPMDLRQGLDHYQDRIERVAFQDYLNLQRVVAQCEFCVVPLFDNDFSQCKSDLKFFEAAAVECPIVVSALPVYQEIVSDGVAGLLAEPHEWHEKLATAVRLASAERESYLTMAAAARDLSIERYSWDRQADRIVGAIKQLV